MRVFGLEVTGLAILNQAQICGRVVYRLPGPVVAMAAIALVVLAIAS